MMDDTPIIATFVGRRRGPVGTIAPLIAHTNPPEDPAADPPQAPLLFVAPAADSVSDLAALAPVGHEGLEPSANGSLRDPAS
jgi:hypothetical protein